MEVKLSKDEQATLEAAKNLEDLQKVPGWHLVVKLLEERAKVAEDRHWASQSSDPLVALGLKLIAGERRGTIAWLLNHIEEVKKARREILAEIYRVPEEKINEALFEETGEIL